MSNNIDWNYSKNHLNKVFVFINFSKNFSEHIRMENQDYKNENTEREYLKNMWNYQSFKVKKIVF